MVVHKEDKYRDVLQIPGMLERFMLVFWEHHWKGPSEEENFKRKIKELVNIVEEVKDD